MKKTGAKRVSGYDSGLGSAVLTAPEESYASEGSRKGPAPAGALQRGFGRATYDEAGADSYGQNDEEYAPQRGKVRLRFGGLMRSVGGRIVLGVVGFAVLGAAAVAFAEVRSFLMHDGRFVVASSDDIQITGADHLSREQILSVFGSDLERNIFRVSLAERQADLQRLPWVEHATVMRLLPDVLRVQITERTPVAFVRQGSQIGLVDGSGVLLDMPSDAAGDPHYSFPVLTGLSGDEAATERAAKMDVYEQFLRELDGGGQRRTESVSEVDVADPEDVKALITSGSSDILVHFGQEKFLQRYEEFEQHLAEWKEQYPKLASADMRYDGQIVLEMQGEGVATKVGTGAGATASVASPAAGMPKPVTEAKMVATKPAVLKTVAAKTVGPKTAVARAPAPKLAAVNAAATVPLGNAAALKVAAAKPGVVKPDLSHANMPKAAAPQPVVLNGPVTKPAVTKAVAAPKLVAPKVKAPGAKMVVAKGAAPAKAKAGSGMSAANARVFARLAAEHRAELEKRHKTAAGNVAKNGKAKGGVTP